MPPVMGMPTDLSPATLKLLDAAITDLCADFQGREAKALIEGEQRAKIQSIGIRDLFKS